MELKGKTANFLGDSITEGYGVTDHLHNRYDNVVKKECELETVRNYGVGGSRLAHQTHSSSWSPKCDLEFCGRAALMDRQADLVVVYGGVNDYIHGDASVGSPEDRTPATFYGAVWFLMNYLKAHYQNSQIVFMTPAHCCYRGVSDAVPSKRETKLSDAMPLIGYVRIIEERAKEFNIPVLNLYEKLGIDPNFHEDFEKYTMDGLHFNDLGSRKLGECLINFLKEL